MNRPWQETHPFISFSIDARKVSPRLWTLLGQVISKTRHISGAPLLPDTAAQMLLTSLIKGAHATSAIEGNTLSESQVLEIHNGIDSIPSSRAYQAEEVKNVLAAMNHLATGGVQRDITLDLIHDINERLLRGLSLEQGIVPGRIREGGVSAGRYLAPSHHEVHELLEKFIAWTNLSYEMENTVGIPFPGEAVLRAVLAHILFVWIHPFGDGNGRTARLVEQNLLLAAGIPFVSAHLLSNHYNLTRDRYYEHLDQARVQRNPFIFAEYAIEGLVDGLQLQIEYVQSQQFQTLWSRLVDERIGGHTPAKHRQKMLAVELGNQEKPVRKSDIPRLSVDLASLYAGKTTKAITRDLNSLLQHALVIRDESRLYSANRMIVFSLVSPRLT